MKLAGEGIVVFIADMAEDLARYGANDKKHLR